MTSENQDDKNCKKNVEDPDVDRGYAWVILVGCFFIYMFIFGTLKSHGLLYIEMVEYYSSGSGNTAWVGSMVWLFLHILDRQGGMNGTDMYLCKGPVANGLSRRFSFRKVTVIGGILVGTGYFLSGFVKKIEFMYLTFTFTGIGFGLTFLPCTTIINFYFHKRRALANGIMMSSGGIGVFLFPFLYKFLIEKYGLLHTFWIIGAIVSNICVAGCLLRQPSLLIKKKKGNSHCNKQGVKYENTSDNTSKPDSEKNDDSEQKQEQLRKCCGFDLKLKLFKNPVFTMYVVAFIFALFGVSNNSLLIPAHMKALGFDKFYVALGVSITGGVEIVSRILFGWFVDLNLVKIKYLFIGSMLLAGIVALITPLFTSFAFMAVYASVMTAFPASFLSYSLSVLTIEVVGLEDYPAAYGLISFCMAFASLINQPICGWMEDYYGDWHSSFILTGSVFVLAGVTVLVEPVISRLYHKRKQAKEESQVSNLKDVDKNEVEIEIVCRKDENTIGKTNLALVREEQTNTVYSLEAKF